MSLQHGPVREFIYLDWERVRALAAQLLSEDGAPLVDAGRAEGTLSVLTGQSGSDYRYFRNENETRSLQVQVCTQVEKVLVEKGAMTRIDEAFDFSRWQREAFRDGQFVRVTGAVRILDYPWMASLMETLPKMMRVSQRAELNALKQKRDAHQITQKDVEAAVKEHQNQLNDMGNWKIDELTAVVRELYGDVVRIKVQASREQPNKVLLGSGAPKHFYETPAVLAQRYGCDIDARWIVLGQVNIASNPESLEAMPTGNAMEDMFERIGLAMNNVHRVASAPTFPTVSFAPLAIYREC